LLHPKKDSDLALPAIKTRRKVMYSHSYWNDG